MEKAIPHLNHLPGTESGIKRRHVSAIMRMSEASTRRSDTCQYTALVTMESISERCTYMACVSICGGDKT